MAKRSVDSLDGVGRMGLSTISTALYSACTYLATAHAFTAFSSTTFFRNCVSVAGFRQLGHSSFSLRQFLTHYNVSRSLCLDVVVSP